MAYPFIPDAQAQGLQGQVDTQNSYYETARQNAAQSQQQAALIAQQRLAAPGIPTGAYQPIAASGTPPSDPKYQSVASYVPRPDTNSMRYSFWGGLDGALVNAAKTGAADVIQGAQHDARYTPAQREQLLGLDWIKRATAAKQSEGFTYNPFHDLGVIADKATPYATSALSYGWEAGQNLVGIANAPERGDFKTALDPSSYKTAVGSGTTLGQNIEHGAGTGILSTTPDNQAQLNREQGALRGYNAAGTAGSIGTYGTDTINLAGQTVFRHQLIAPGSVGYGVASGLIDLAASQKLDPANLAFQKWHDVAVLHDTFDVNPVARDAGLINGVRKVVNPTRFDDWLQTGKGQRAISDLAKTDSAGEIMSRTGFKMPLALAGKLAASNDPTEVAGLLRDAVGAEFKYVPNVSHFAGLGGTGYAIRTALHDTRYLSDLPEFSSSVNNVDQLAKNVELAGRTANLPRDVRWGYLDQLGRVAASDTPEAYGASAYQNVIDGLLHDTEKQIAGTRWFASDHGQEFLSGLYRLRTNPEFPDEVRTALETEFPHATFSDQNIDDVTHLLTRSGDPQSAQSIVGQYLSGRPETNPALLRARGGIGSLAEWTGDPELASRQGVAALGKSHMSGEAAQRITRAYQGRLGAMTARWLDPEGSLGSVGHVVSDGKVMPVTTPFSTNELLQETIPFPDFRAVRQATTHAPNLLAWTKSDGLHLINPFLTPEGEQRLWLNFADTATAAWKGVVSHLRPGLLGRIVANEQVALSTEHVQTALSHPFRALASVIASDDPDANALQRYAEAVSGGKTDYLDVAGSDFAKQLDHTGSQLRAASAADNNPLAERPDRWFMSHYEAVARPTEVMPQGTHGLPTYLKGWGQEITGRALAPIDSAVARALRVADPAEQEAALNAVKQEFWDGDYSKLRQAIIAGGDHSDTDWMSPLVDRNNADEYINGLARRVSGISAGDDGLLEAIGEKTLGGKSIGAALGKTKGNDLDPAFQQYLKGLYSNGVGPTQVRARIDDLAFAGREGKVGKALDQAHQWVLDHTVSIPTNKLLRVPAIHDEYWNEVDRLAPRADDETRQSIADAWTNGDASLLPPTVDGRRLTKAEVDLLAKNYAVDRLHTLVYNAHSTNNFADMMRNYVPFGNLWRQELHRWLTIGPANAPLIARRLGQMYGTLKQSGVIAPDPKTGQEAIHIPIPGIAQEASQVLATGLSAASVPFGGTFHNSIGTPTEADASLNVDPSKALFVTQGLPGIGAVVSLPISVALQHAPDGAAISNALMPFGATDTSSGVGNAALSTFTPTWVRYGLNALRPPNAKQNASMMADAIHYRMETNPQEYTGPEGNQKLISDAADMVRGMWIVRSLGEAFSPAGAPTLDQPAPSKAGWVELKTIADDYYNNILPAAIAKNGTTADATRTLLDKYGLSAGLAITDQTLAMPYGLYASSAMNDWKDQNPGLADKYKNVWPYFAPNPQGKSGGVDYTAIQKQISVGDRDVLNPTQRLDLSQYRVGAYVYDKYRSAFGANPTRAQQQWLDQYVRPAVAKDFPGWGENQGQWPHDIPTRVPHQTAVADLARAATDPALADNPAVRGLRDYLALREAAIESLGAQNDADPSKALGDKNAGPTRAWLASVANVVLKKYPAFAPMWSGFFHPEVQVQGAPPNG